MFMARKHQYYLYWWNPATDMDALPRGQKNLNNCSVCAFTTCSKKRSPCVQYPEFSQYLAQGAVSHPFPSIPKNLVQALLSKPKLFVQFFRFSWSLFLGLSKTRIWNDFLVCQQKNKAKLNICKHRCGTQLYIFKRTEDLHHFYKKWWLYFVNRCTIATTLFRILVRKQLWKFCTFSFRSRIWCVDGIWWNSMWFVNLRKMGFIYI
jgi:hypothetical protein